MVWNPNWNSDVWFSTELSKNITNPLVSLRFSVVIPEKEISKTKKVQEYYAILDLYKPKYVTWNLVEVQEFKQVSLGDSPTLMSSFKSTQFKESILILVIFKHQSSCKW